MASSQPEVAERPCGTLNTERFCNVLQLPLCQDLGRCPTTSSSLQSDYSTFCYIQVIVCSRSGCHTLTRQGEMDESGDRRRSLRLATNTEQLSEADDQ